MSLSGGALRRVVDVRPGEGAALASASAAAFCILLCNYLIRPIRDAMGLEGGSKNLPNLWLYTCVATLVLTPLFSTLVSRTSRRQFMPIAYRFFALSLLALGAAFHGLPAWRVALSSVFYPWAAAINIFMISILWGFFADVFTSDQGKRLFGFVGVGGTLGAIAGSALSTFTATRLGYVESLLLPWAALEATLLCVRSLDRAAARFGHGVEVRTVDPSWRASLDGFDLVRRSPDLLAFASLILLFTLTSSFVEMGKNEAVERLIVGADKVATGALRKEAFSAMDLATNALALPLHVFLAGRMLRWWGVGLTLALLPAVTALGYGVFALEPSLFLVGAYVSVRKAVDFALAKPSREILFTSLPRDAKYKAKSFLDTFVYRGGDALGSQLWRIASALPVAATLIGIWSLLWGLIALWLGRRHEARVSGGDRR